MSEIEIKLSLLSETATIPFKGSDGAAGQDLFADITENIILKPNDTCKIPTGVAIELNPDTFGAVVPRSGMATNRGLGLINSIGIIDCDYRGEILVPIHNFSNTEQIICPNERIAQIIVLPYLNVKYINVNKENLSSTDRGIKGFGSTGIK